MVFVLGIAAVLHLHRSLDREVVTWRRQAACRGADPALFHPDDESDDAAVDAARDVCEGCAVRQPCLEYALSAREPDGIWGGLTAKERRRELRRRRKSA